MGWIHPGVVMRRMNVNGAQLLALLHEGRDMLSNRMKKDLHTA
jgi:hypothetical protein